MRVNGVFSLLVICALGVIVRCNETTVTRAKRTLPFSFPSSQTFRELWPNGSFWQWPRINARTLLRLLASPDTRKKIPFEFKPEDGMRAAYEYQQRYGYRGERLIELIGSGYHPDTLQFQQPLPALHLTPPLPPF